MIGGWFKKDSSPEACLSDHCQFSVAYKIEGCVVPGENSFLCQGQAVFYTRAALFLCIKHSINEVERVKAWESSEYEFANEAEVFLREECQLISKLINKRIEIIELDLNSNKYIVTEVFNANNRQYWLEETNL
tara:strand:+ start:2481 stop:2879 length:399 start_codon:yes stop_codon:yes gene_type:complete